MTSSKFDPPIGQLPQHRRLINHPDSKISLESRRLGQCSSPDARRTLAFDEATRLNSLPLGIIQLGDQQILTIAIPDGASNISEIIQKLKFATGYNIKPVPVEIDVLREAIFFAYNGEDELRARSIALTDSSCSSSVSVLTPGRPQLRSSSSGVPGLLSALIDYAISRNATDLHLVPRTNGALIRIRIAGTLRDNEEVLCTAQIYSQLVSRIKVLAEMDITRKNSPQDGAFYVQVPTRTVHIRVATLPTVHGERVALRFMGCAGVMTIDSLGLDECTEFLLENFLGRSDGALLLAGPTGSGKTTTMYAIMEHLSRRRASCLSIEDPVEIHLADISQTTVDEKSGLTYPVCLRSILRQDPDVIMLGEIRDHESAGCALQAALTGHLLLSTVHARNCIEVLLRLRNLGIDLLTITQAVSLIISQRLLPRLCAKCRVIDLEVSNRLQFDVYREVGCNECDYSGFLGQILISESLSLSTGLGQEIFRRNLNDIEDCLQNNQKCHSPLKHSLEAALRQGNITARQVATHAGGPEFEIS